MEERRAAGRRCVHEVARAADEPFETRDDRIVRELPSREREIGRRGAVRGAEAANAVGAEPLRPLPRPPHELRQLLPGGLALPDETL